MRFLTPVSYTHLDVYKRQTWYTEMTTDRRHWKDWFWRLRLTSRCSAGEEKEEEQETKKIIL